MVLYLSIGAGFLRSGATPQLTIGNLLLRRRRLSQLRAELDAKQDARLEAALGQHDRVQREWTVHYENKLKQELRARLKLLRSFLFDCSENPRNCAAVYPVEALRRTVMQEILLAMDEFGYSRDGAATQVDVADVALRRVLQAGDFIWSADLETVYLRSISGGCMGVRRLTRPAKPSWPFVDLRIAGSLLFTVFPGPRF